MGLFSLVFGRKPNNAPKQAEGQFETFTAYSPRFTNWSGQIYENELCRAAVDAIARHVGKLKFDMIGSAHGTLRTIVRSAPNPWMTWPQFLERASNIYQTQSNLFVVPVLSAPYREIAGFFPVVPSQCEIVRRSGDDTPYLKFQFVGGQVMSLPLSRVSVIPKHQLNDDFFGESDYKALSSTLELENMISQGIIEGVKNSATFRFMAQTTQYLFDEDLTKERKRFDRLNFQGESGGLLLFNNNVQNVQQLKQDGYKVDPEQMKLIQANVERFFGVNEKVLTNAANGDDLDAFWNGCIEPFSIKLSEALTNMVYSQTERNNGNRIIFAANRLQYMNVASKISMAQQLGDRGVLMIDEIRELFNYPPLPDGAGQHAPIRGEYYMVDEGRDPDADGGGTGDPAGESGTDSGKGGNEE